jgi:hypothetical protein
MLLMMMMISGGVGQESRHYDDVPINFSQTIFNSEGL